VLLSSVFPLSYDSFFAGPKRALPDPDSSYHLIFITGIDNQFYASNTNTHTFINNACLCCISSITFDHMQTMNNVDNFGTGLSHVAIDCGTSRRGGESQDSPLILSDITLAIG